MSSLHTLVLLVAMASMGIESQVQEPSPGTGEITGRVTDTETGRAIAGAVVRLARLGDNNGEPPSAITDGEGRYRLLGLRAGTYTGFADDGNYLTARL
ncbi:MAG: carboxypeptidase-like regulatory domain-containing protein, partial [Vicinamibacterales bacterium]